MTAPDQTFGMSRVPTFPKDEQMTRPALIHRMTPDRGYARSERCIHGEFAGECNICVNTLRGPDDDR